MTTRERWIVYPLLFLALGTAVKPKLVPPDITCRRLIVLDEERRSRVQLGVTGDDADPFLQLVAANGLPLITLRSDPTAQAGRIETRTVNGVLQTAMTSTATGGELIAQDRAAKNEIGIGYRDGHAGLFDSDLTTRRSVLLPIEMTPRSDSK
jgi:hypothetical protein